MRIMTVVTETFLFRGFSEVVCGGATHPLFLRYRSEYEDYAESQAGEPHIWKSPREEGGNKSRSIVGPSGLDRQFRLTQSPLWFPASIRSDSRTGSSMCPPW